MTPTNAHRSMENIVEREVRARRSGRWPDWKRSPINGVPGATGWAAEFTSAAENGVFCVLIRELQTPWGVVKHAMIGASATGVEPTWGEKQRIKNELLGRNATAIEFFPAVGDLVDCGRPVYHLFAVPDNAIPFGLQDTHGASSAEASPSPPGGEAPDTRHECGGEGYIPATDQGQAP